MRGLHELLTAKFFNIDPTAAAGYRQMIERNLNGHVPFLGVDKIIGKKVSAVSHDVIEDVRISTESGMEVNRYNDNQDDPFIDVLIIDGPMTRSGDLCSYGSVDHRDMMISAANNQNCVGHLFIVNTPGGTAFTHNDYQQAIDYAHSKNQPVVMWIDGICMSAGMYLATMCDERYYMHPKDEVGCIGTMAMFYTMKEGDKDFNGETYHEIYADSSYNKNEAFRNIADNGDDKLLKETLNKHDAEFRAAVKAAFPKADDDMTHGKTYEAETVKGIFLDGQSDLGGAFQRVIDLAKKQGNTAAVNASSLAQSASHQSSTQITMNKKYQNVAAMLGIDELAVKTDGKQDIENGSFLNTEQLDTMEAQLASLKEKADKADGLQASLDKAQSELADAKASLTEKDSTIAQMKADSDKATADAKVDKDTALAAQKADSDKQVSDLNARIASMEQTAKDNATRIAELEQTVKDKDAQIDELSHDPGAAPAAGASPASNGTGAQETEISAVQPVFDPSKETYAHFIERTSK